MPRIDPVPAAAAVLALAAMAAALIIQTQTREDIRVLATQMSQLQADNAQLSQKLDAAARPNADLATAIATVSERNADALMALQNRIAALEGMVRAQPQASASGGLATDPTATGALPALSGSTGPIQNGNAAAREECIPPGTQFVLAQGDSYAICTLNAKVTATTIGPDQVVFDKIGLVNAAGSGPIGDRCRVTVLSVTDGFARARVTC